MEITQGDREAAVGYWGNDNPPLELLAAMSAHRIAAEQRIVEWLRERDGVNDFYSEFHGKWLSDRIESGEHLPRFVRVPHIGEAS